MFFNPAVTDGETLFTNIVIFIAAFGAALTLVDVKKINEKSK